MLKAGIPLSKIDLFRDLLEQYGLSTDICFKPDRPAPIHSSKQTGLLKGYKWETLECDF